MVDIDERALEAAIKAYKRVACLYNPSDEAARIVAEDLIEAYEAARPDPNPWRPVGEFPKDGKQRLVLWGRDHMPSFNRRAGYEVIWWNRSAGLGRPFWMSGQEPMDEGPWFHGAMFREITPPKQDADSQATSTPPTAGTGS